MEQTLIPRYLEAEIQEHLLDFPVVAILGPRQCGKTTLCLEIARKFKGSIYLDLEKPSDLRKLEDPELFFSLHKEDLVCLDEIQLKPHLFSVLRTLVDENRRNGQFLILGSASRDLIQQSSQSLAGRIGYLELSPFLCTEVIQEKENIHLFQFWIRGGFPTSYLARSKKSSRSWRENFIRTFLERDIPQLGSRIPAKTLSRLWQMLAHHHGQMLNASILGQSMGVSHTTIRSYIDLLTQTFMVRLLPPLAVNVKKRLVKSPKVYIRDSGVLHSLLDIAEMDSLMAHPIFGASWEGMALENILTFLPGWKASFYRTRAGAEIDLVLEKGERKVAIEFKASTSPKVNKGFWNAMEDLNINEGWIIAPVEEAYPIRKNVYVSSLPNFLKSFEAL